MSVHPDETRSVVVVGGGLAGVTVAAELRRRGYDGAVTVLDAGTLLHDRPPLSKQYLVGEMDEQHLALVDGEWLAAHAVDVRLGHQVTAVHPEDDRVVVDLQHGPQLAADVVVLATGGVPRALPVPGGSLAHPLRTVEDARWLRERLRPGARLLVVGAGLIGAEVASSATALGAEVILVDPLDPPLVDAVGPEMAAWLHAEHARHGVRAVQAQVQRLDRDGEQVLAVLSGHADPVRADVVLAGIGITADTALAERAGLAVDGGVLVDPAGRTSHPRVLAAGDASRTRDADGRPLPRFEHWESAERGGLSVAASLLGQAPPAPTVPRFWSDRYGRHVEVLGQMAEATTTIRRGDLGGPRSAVLGLDGDRLAAAVVLDDPRATRALRRIIDGGVSVGAAVLADPATDLRRLSKP